MEEIITTNFGQTQQLGRDFAQQLHGGDVVCLYGDLGAGKTTFTQGLVQGLGIKRRIISPTFVIVRTYVLPEENKLYHVDLYRLSKETEIEGTGLLDIIGKKDHIVIIEWPEKMGSLLPKKRWDIHFTYVDEEKRDIKIHNLYK